MLPFSKMVPMSLVRFTNARFVGWVDSGLELPPIFLEDPTAVFRLPEAEVVLNCEARQIVRFGLEWNGEKQLFFLYIFKNRSFSRALRRNYAFHILRMSQLLRDKEIETLRVVAAYRPRRQFLNWRSYLIVREIESVLELPAVGRHSYQLHQRITLDGGLIKAVARQIAVLHNLGFVHGDLKSRHVLVRRNGLEPELSDIVLVDLEKTRSLGRWPNSLGDLYAARDLIQLLSSIPDQADSLPLSDRKKELILTYFAQRRLPPARSSRIEHFVNLYGPQGSFRQGRTLVGELLRRLRSSRRRK